jgi:hypothetical protein
MTRDLHDDDDEDEEDESEVDQDFPDDAKMGDLPHYVCIFCGWMDVGQKRRRCAECKRELLPDYVGISFDEANIMRFAVETQRDWMLLYGNNPETKRHIASDVAAYRALMAKQIDSKEYARRLDEAHLRHKTEMSRTKPRGCAGSAVLMVAAGATIVYSALTR